MSGVVLSAHGRIITAMETGGLYYTRTFHTLFFLRMIEILHLLCRYLLITALNLAAEGYSLYMRACSTEGTISLLVLNPYRNTLPSSEWLL